jgi:hypothetical protein
MAKSLGALQDDLAATLFAWIEGQTGVSFARSLRTFIAAPMIVLTSTFAFWSIVIVNMQSAGFSVPRINSLLLASAAVVMYLASVLINRMSVRHRKIFAANFALCAVAFYLEASIFLEFYNFIQILYIGFDNIVEFAPLDSVLSISILAWPYIAGKAVEQELGRPWVRLSNARRILYRYENGLLAVVSSLPRVLVQGPLLLLELVLMVLFRSRISITTYQGVVAPDFAEVILGKKCTRIIPEDASFQGYHYWFISFAPPYFVRAFGEKTTILTARGNKLPIVSSLRPWVTQEEGRTDAEISIDVKKAGYPNAHLSCLFSFHNTSRRRIVQRGARFMFPTGVAVKFSDYFQELYPTTRLHGNQVLYDLAFREPVRPGNTYSVKIDFDALLGSAEGAWYLDMNSMMDHDLTDVLIHLLIHDGVFKYVRPDPRFMSGNKADLMLSLRRNSTTRISMEFESE